MKRSRVCNHPKHGGKSCSVEGVPEDSRLCNTHLCRKKHVACACEGEKAKLSCKEGSGFIRINHPDDVFYGRKETAVCATKYVSGWDYNCIAAQGGSKVSALCDGKQECEIPVTNGFFGNPCKNTYKYLRVHYECVSGYYDRVRNYCGVCGWKHVGRKRQIAADIRQIYVK